MREVLKSSICKKCVKLILMLFLLFFTVTSVYPLIWLVFFSFKSNQEIFGGNIMGPPENWLVKNYENALLGGKVLRYLGNSIMVAVVVIVISTVPHLHGCLCSDKNEVETAGSGLLVFHGGADNPHSRNTASAVYRI